MFLFPPVFFDSDIVQSLGGDYRIKGVGEEVHTYSNMTLRRLKCDRPYFAPPFSYKGCEFWEFPANPLSLTLFPKPAYNDWVTSQYDQLNLPPPLTILIPLSADPLWRRNGGLCGNKQSHLSIQTLEVSLRELLLTITIDPN